MTAQGNDIAQLVQTGDRELFGGSIEEAVKACNAIFAAGLAQLPLDAYCLRIGVQLAIGQTAEALNVCGQLLARPELAGNIVLNKLNVVGLSRSGQWEAAFQRYQPYLRAMTDADRPREAHWYDAKIQGAGPDAPGLAEDVFEEQAGRAATALELNPSDALLVIGDEAGLLAAKLAGLARVAQVDIASRPKGTHDKALMMGVSPRLASFAALDAALRNAHACLRRDGICLLGNNYDAASIDAAAMAALKNANGLPFAHQFALLRMLENLLWIDVERLKAAVKDAGFAAHSILNRREQPDGRVMFDLLLRK